MALLSLQTHIFNDLLKISFALFVVLLLLVPLTLICTYVFTTLRYRKALYLSGDTETPQEPPYVPYAIPFLGSALSFLAPMPGRFWDNLRSSIPSSFQACTILLGGNKTHVIYSPAAVQQLFKAKHVNRERFNYQVLLKGFGMSLLDVRKFYGAPLPKGKEIPPSQALKEKKKGFETPGELLRIKKEHEKTNHEYLLTQSAVNELTTKFIEIFKEVLAGQCKQWTEVNLYDWLRLQMFDASTTAFMGDRILKMFPNIGRDFFIMDLDFLSLFFGIPKFMIPHIYASRDTVVDQLAKWVGDGLEQCGGVIPDPDGASWEPIFGSRIARARQKSFIDRDVSVRGRAGLELGFLFALSSNAIPMTGWMLFHILSSDESSPSGPLLPLVMEELETARLADGSVDIPTLIALPLLESIFHEALRMYIDILITREVLEDLVIDFPASSPHGQATKMLLKKSDIVMAPSWLGHRDPQAWEEAPFDQFYAQRFLKTDPASGKTVFSITGTTGKLFPFGGGKTICPGRVFAKQEVFGAIAMVLLQFEFEFVKFVDLEDKTGKGKPREFPGLRKAYTGNGVMAMDGDMRVRMKSRVRDVKG